MANTSMESTFWAVFSIARFTLNGENGTPVALRPDNIKAEKNNESLSMTMSKQITSLQMYGWTHL